MSKLSKFRLAGSSEHDRPNLLSTVRRDFPSLEIFLSVGPKYFWLWTILPTTCWDNLEASRCAEGGVGALSISVFFTDQTASHSPGWPGHAAESVSETHQPTTTIGLVFRNIYCQKYFKYFPHIHLSHHKAEWLKCSLTDCPPPPISHKAAKKTNFSFQFVWYWEYWLRN